VVTADKGAVAAATLLLLLSILSLSAGILNLLYPSTPSQYPFMFQPSWLTLQFWGSAVEAAPFVSGALGFTSIAELYLKRTRTYLPAAYLILFVTSRFASFISSGYLLQPLLPVALLTALFPDATIYHSLAYLACTLAALPVLIYLTREY